MNLDSLVSVLIGFLMIFDLLRAFGGIVAEIMDICLSDVAGPFVEVLIALTQNPVIDIPWTKGYGHSGEPVTRRVIV